MTMRVMVMLLVLPLLGAVSCSSMGQSGGEGCENVRQVLSNSTSVSGTDVAVCGVIRYEFEDKNLYASKAAAKKQSDDDCISLGKADEFVGDLERLSGQWVRVSGTVITNFCPEGTLCTSSCSDTGVLVKEIAVQR